MREERYEGQLRHLRSKTRGKLLIWVNDGRRVRRHLMLLIIPYHFADSRYIDEALVSSVLQNVRIQERAN